MNKFYPFLRKAMRTAKRICQRQLGGIGRKQLMNGAAALLMTVAVTDVFLLVNGDSTPPKTEQNDIVLASAEKEGLESTDDYDDFELVTANVESVNINLLMDSLIVEEETLSEESTEAYEENTEAAEAYEAVMPIVSYTEEDYSNLLRIVEAEATGADMMAKILVANVVINRVKSGAFPNTITEVIFQGNGEQFQPIIDGRFYSVSVTDTTVEAVNRALYGEDYSQGAYFFATYEAAGYWHSNALTKLFEYGGHVYFTF